MWIYTHHIWCDSWNGRWGILDSASERLSAQRLLIAGSTQTVSRDPDYGCRALRAFFLRPMQKRHCCFLSSIIGVEPFALQPRTWPALALNRPRLPGLCDTIKGSWFESKSLYALTLCISSMDSILHDHNILWDGSDMSVSARFGGVPPSA